MDFAINVTDFTRSSSTSWKIKSVVIVALTLLTSSQPILIVWSKRAGKYEYSFPTTLFLVEALKCAFSLTALCRVWITEGATNKNRLITPYDKVYVYILPSIFYYLKNTLQYFIFEFVDAPTFQILKNLNIISTSVLYQSELEMKISKTQWISFILLCVGCTITQINSFSDQVLKTQLPGWLIAVVMTYFTGIATVYTDIIIEKRPSRNINVHNFWLSIFGMLFNMIGVFGDNFHIIVKNGFFHGYSFITVCMIFNHALGGIVVSMIMKFINNIMKVYATSVAMLLTGIVSVFLFGFNISFPFFLGMMIVSFSIRLHSVGKSKRVFTFANWPDI